MLYLNLLENGYFPFFLKFKRGLSFLMLKIYGSCVNNKGLKFFHIHGCLSLFIDRTSHTTSLYFSHLIVRPYKYIYVFLQVSAVFQTIDKTDMRVQKNVMRFS
jgi:hypothetical protein